MCFGECIDICGDAADARASAGGSGAAERDDCFVGDGLIIDANQPSGDGFGEFECSHGVVGEDAERQPVLAIVAIATA